MEISGEPSREKESTVVIFERFKEGLVGLDQFSNAIVLYHLHLSSFSGLVKERNGVRVGIFATRSPNRPNPIGLSVVEVLEIRGTKIKVKGLNAFNGTPVLDVKPYDKWDCVPNPRVPKWHQVQ